METKIQIIKVFLLAIICLSICFSCDPGEKFEIHNKSSFTFIPVIIENDSVHKNHECHSVYSYKNYERNKSKPGSVVVLGVGMIKLKGYIKYSYNQKLNIALIKNDTLEKYKENTCFIFENKIFTHLEFTYEEMKTNNNVITITNEDLY